MDKRRWVSRHDPVLTAFTPEAPLSVGNGDFAFTADVTGLQTFTERGKKSVPLCTMANWGWHTLPAGNTKARYAPEDVLMDEYDFYGRKVTYARTRRPGNERVYDWLRMNPHKFSLARIGLRLCGAEPDMRAFSEIRQTLHLYDGLLESRFLLQGKPCRVTTLCDAQADILAVKVESELLLEGLSIELCFPYGSAAQSGADWAQPDLHETRLDGHLILRKMDDTRYALRLCAPGADIRQMGPHCIRVDANAKEIELSVAFCPGDSAQAEPFDEVARRTRAWWNRFWEKGGAIDLSAAADPRARELERRIVLSLYNLTVNSAGSMPPAETGLTCNSWYGKAHLEMHFWHMAWAPLWGHRELLERSVGWYRAHLTQARENAARNGYAGARWPKMTGPDGDNSPSNIAVLLVWQQPHILSMLELIYRARMSEGDTGAEAFLAENWPLVRETADFMADYAVQDAQGIRHLEPPLIPVQERHEPEETRDPAFEIAYWRFGLNLAAAWARRLRKPVPPAWLDAARNMAMPRIADGVYIAHANCPDTFTRKAIDHPSMLQIDGMLPPHHIDEAAMNRTLDAVIRAWDKETLWGWDFAVMAMTAARLGRPEDAVSLLLCDTPKNAYAVNGHNRQAQRADLPLYLPGNGSLLLCAAMMAAGWDGCAPCGGKRFPGFPKDGWALSCEGIHPYL